AVLYAAGVDRSHVFGFSMGGFIAQEFALQYPDRVRSLILAATACGGLEGVRSATEVLTALEAKDVRTPEEAFWMIAPYNYNHSTPRALIEEDLAVTLRSPVKRRSYMAQPKAI